MTKISKKAQAAETTTEVVNTPAEVQTTPIEAPKEEILEEPISDVEFEEAPNEDLPSLDEIKAKERALRKR
jgi:hypothetical protein